MTFTSPDAFREFERSVRYELRYVRGSLADDFLASVVETSIPRSITLHARHILWRARLGHDWFHEQQGEDRFKVEGPYWPNQMKPISENAIDGRVNPKGIPCLYLATRQETAVLEIRPLIGSYVSVGQFKVRKDARLVDCSRDRRDPLARIGHLLDKKTMDPEGNRKSSLVRYQPCFLETVAARG